ncbi:D-Ala-D-Ala carboxypeptidase family metallohydrolase [Granulosicoccus sp. 3-233]|uniref:D-Ala-D-Ala carboxypeptidase family metallohydrolase n=1 Tax=Granulosicoccus sp. 3-233 TaxID=3417969 RepID=UPI003D34DED4
MSRISLEELQMQVASGNITEDDLRKYFELDPEKSGPFAPRFRINPRTVKVPPEGGYSARSAQLLNLANWLARADRRHRYEERIRGGYTGPRIVSEGDSWFQFPVLLKDTIDHVSDHHAVYSLGAAGDLLERMAHQQEYLKALDDTGASILMLSGGGNDLVAGGALASHLESYHRDLSPADYLLPSFDELLGNAFGYYERILRQVRGSFPHVHVLYHGYDYSIPDNGRWLGKPMQERGIRSRELQAAITREMVDRLNRGLRRLSRSIPKVTYIDCRGTVRHDQWYDELHPTNEGYGAVAALFLREIRRIDNQAPSIPTRVAISGPFGDAEQLRRSMHQDANEQAAARDDHDPDGPAGRAISLHVGLNRIDPFHYAGWDGKLKSCEHDARDMAAIAASQGFRTKLLLTAHATRDAVVSAIKDAANELQHGDMFMFTVSGHGGIMPDFNMDEHDPEDRRFDESLCLYDFQIIDDELYHLWTRFRPGVRVLMVADTCHSGDMVRYVPPRPHFPGFDLPVYSDATSARRMPRDVAERVWLRNLDDYKAYASQFERVDERIVNNPMTAAVNASVLHLGACHEEQLAGDGARNGRFTAALKTVWNNGTFTGNYGEFIDEINRAMNWQTQTAQLNTSLVRDQGYLAQVPFSQWERPSRHSLQGFPPGSSPFNQWLENITEVPFQDAGMSDEGNESDVISQEDIERFFAQTDTATGARGTARLSSRSGHSAREQWEDYPAFVSFIATLGLEYFSADEFLLHGTATPGDGGTPVENDFPPRTLWPNIVNTAKVLDNYRKRSGRPILITSAYRSDRYNRAVGGKPGSQHKRFSALDFVVRDVPAHEVAAEIRRMRDFEGSFHGGVGRYNTFTHLDTRGENCTWPVEFRDTTPMISSDQNRRTAVRGMRLAKASDSSSRSRDAMTPPVPGDLDAAINASSLISFTDNMPVSHKSDILSSTLFAQLAADAAADPISERQRWFDTYIDTLSLLGWLRSSSPVLITKSVSGSATINGAILDTIAAVATGNQMQILKEAIKSLKALTSSDQTIALFDRNTTYRNGSNFQIGAADSSTGVLSLALGAYNFVHNDQKKNILFIHWGKETLELWVTSQTMTMELTRYDEVREIVNSRIREVQREALVAIPLKGKASTAT